MEIRFKPLSKKNTDDSANSHRMKQKQVNKTRLPVVQLSKVEKTERNDSVSMEIDEICTDFDTSKVLSAMLIYIYLIF